MTDNAEAANDNSVPRTPLAATPPAGSMGMGAGGGLIGLIERLSTNPNFNIEIMNALLAARREEEDRAAERAFNAALSAAKGELEPILKKHDVDFTSKDPGKGRTKYKYEQLFDIAQAVDPVFAKHGLSYRFDHSQQGDRIFVSTILAHADGYTRHGHPLEGSSAIPSGSNMNPLQALGSAMTYLQRIGLRAAIGVAAGKDDDAMSLTPASPKIDANQANELERLFEETGASQMSILHLYAVDTVGDLNVDQWTRAKEILGLRKAEKQRKRHAADPGS
jgi:hypothetical protein